MWLDLLLGEGKKIKFYTANLGINRNAAFAEVKQEKVIPNKGKKKKSFLAASDSL